MDDSTTIKKKKFGGIRKLGKFFGLGGSATKSETKSQIDDYEEFDLSTATNGIESIMALTPEQKALPVILLTEPEPQPPSPASINSSGFKPKSIPTSLNRAPGRTPLSSRSQDSKILEPVPTPDPSPPPPSAAPVSVPTQRVEDIIRLKIPLHRRNSKLTTSESEERIESQLPSSPVAVNGRSPMPRADQETLIQTLLNSEDPDGRESDEPLSPTTREPQESKFHCDESVAHPSVKVIQITLDLSSESLDSPTVPSEATLIKCRSVSLDEPLRCTSFDPEFANTSAPSPTLPVAVTSDAATAVEEMTRAKSTSCDSEDSFSLNISPELLNQPIVVKSKQDLRAEFLNFRRQNSRVQISQSEESSADGSTAAGVLLNTSLSQSGEDFKAAEKENEEAEDDETVSSYASDEIESVVSSDEEENDNTSDVGSYATGSGSHAIFRTESIPEGDEEEEQDTEDEQLSGKVKVALSQSLSTDTSDVSLSDLRVTATKPKSRMTKAPDSTLSSSSSTKPQRVAAKRMSMSTVSSTAFAASGASATVGSSTGGAVKSSKQRSKSIVPNSTLAPAPAPGSSGGWNGSTKSVAPSKSSNPSLSTQPPLKKSSSRRHSTAPSSSNTNTSPTTHNTATAGPQTPRISSLRSSASFGSSSSSSIVTDSEAFLSSSSSKDPDSPEIKVTKISPTSAAAAAANRRKSMAPSLEKSRIPSSRNVSATAAASGAGVAATGAKR